MLASMCKLKAGRLGRQLNDQCLQFWGGMGFTNDVAISRSYRWDRGLERWEENSRDGRLGSIAGGADEVMLTILAKGMGTLPRKG